MSKKKNKPITHKSTIQAQIVPLEPKPLSTEPKEKVTLGDVRDILETKLKELNPDIERKLDKLEDFMGFGRSYHDIYY
jgi:hypothetical protein